MIQRLLGMLLLALLGTGCALVSKDPRPIPIRAMGEAPILYWREPDPESLPVRSVPWSGSTLRSEVQRVLPGPEGEETPGAALAAASLSARNEARLAIAAQLQSLPATGEESLRRFAERSTALQRVINRVMAEAEMKETVDWEGRSLVVALEVPLADIARELADAGGGLRPGSGPGGLSLAELDRRAEEEAERLAIEAAREDMLRQYGALQVNGDLTVDQAAKDNAAIRATLFLSLNEVEVLSSDRAGNQLWRVELEGDGEPLVREVRIQLKEAERAGRK